MAKWVLHVENLGEVDTEPLLRHIAEEIVVDAKRYAPVRTGRLRDSIHVAEVTDRHAIVEADAKNPESNPGNAAYAGHVERGTSDTPRMPFLAPATYKYRSS